MTFLTTSEIAAMLRVSRNWVWAHAAKKRRPYLPVKNLGSEDRALYRFVKEDVEVWIKELMK